MTNYRWGGCGDGGGYMEATSWFGDGEECGSGYGYGDGAPVLAGEFFGQGEHAYGTEGGTGCMPYSAGVGWGGVNLFVEDS